MDNRLANQLIDCHAPQSLIPEYSAEVFKAGIESQRHVEIQANEAEPMGFQYTREITFDIPVFPGIIDTRFDVSGKMHLATGTTAYLDGSAKALFSLQALEIVNGPVIEELPQANTFNLANDIISNGSESVKRKWASWSQNLLELDGSQSVYGVTGAGLRPPTSAPTNRNFRVPVELGFTKHQRYIHSDKVGVVRVRLLCDDDKNVVSYGDVDPKIYLQNLRLHVRQITMSPGFRQKYLQKPVVYNYERTHYQTKVWDQNTNQITIVKDAGSANMLLVRFRLSSELNTKSYKNLAKSIYPTYAFTKISLTHGGVEIPQTPLVSAYDTYDQLMKVYGVRDDNDQGSLINITNYVAANCGAIPSIVQVSPKTNLEAVPFYFLAYDLTTNGLGTGINMNDSPLIFSTEASGGATTSLYVDCFLTYSAICVAADPNHVQINY